LPIPHPAAAPAIAAAVEPVAQIEPAMVQPASVAMSGVVPASAPAMTPHTAATPSSSSAGPTAPTEMAAQISIHAPALGAGGSQRLTLRLTPDDLGSVTFDVHSAPAGGRSIHIAFERPETLALFQQDRSHLDSALARAGLGAGPGQITLALSSDAPAVPATNPSGSADASSDPTGGGRRGQPPPSPPPLSSVPIDDWGTESSTTPVPRRALARAALDIVA
jgi:hypothetical protein